MPSYYGNDFDNATAVEVDNYYMGDGNDYVEATPFANELYGGRGNDLLMGGSIASFTGANTPTDPLVYRANPSGDDYIEGGSGDDTCLGGDGNDVIYGGDGNDGGVMQGYAGAYWYAGLFGDSGSDQLFGGRGSDFLAGGSERDELRGGPDADTFYFAHMGGAHWDKVADWKSEDGIALELDSFANLSGNPGDVISKKHIVFGKKAADRNDHIIVKQGKNGDYTVFYDANGNKPGQKDKIFKIEDPGGMLKRVDFHLVDFDF